jgi:hypothetical protein
LDGAGAGVERGVVNEREPRLPKDLPPPTRAQASISRTDNRKKSEKSTRPLRAQRFVDIIFSSNIAFFCGRLMVAGDLVNFFLVPLSHAAAILRLCGHIEFEAMREIPLLDICFFFLYDTYHSSAKGAAKRNPLKRD